MAPNPSKHGALVLIVITWYVWTWRTLSWGWSTVSVHMCRGFGAVRINGMSSGPQY